MMAAVRTLSFVLKNCKKLPNLHVGQHHLGDLQENVL